MENTLESFYDVECLNSNNFDYPAVWPQCVKGLYMNLLSLNCYFLDQQNQFLSAQACAAVPPLKDDMFVFSEFKTSGEIEAKKFVSVITTMTWANESFRPHESRATLFRLL